MMNEILYRSPFNQMKAPEKLMLMKELAARYNMTFLGLRRVWKERSGIRLYSRRYSHAGLGTVRRGAESGEPGGIGVPIPGVGNGA